MPNPPIVWHLDTDGINDFSYNPPDRLTRIKEKMKAFQEQDGQNLGKLLREIEAICKESNSPSPEEQS